MHNFYNEFKSPLLWLWLLPHLFAPPAPAQEYLVSIQHYSVPQGLSNQYIQHSLQDRRGLIWAATRFGLNRFDGFDFKQYTLEEDNLRSNDCQQIIEDRNGLLWLACLGAPPGPEQSVDVFDPITEEAMSFEAFFQPPFSGEDIAEMKSDAAGNIYILIQGGQVYRYDGQSFTRILHYQTGEPLRLSVSGTGTAALLDKDKVILLDSLGKILYQALLPEAVDFIRAGKDQFWVGKQHPGEGPSLWGIRPGRAPEPLYFRDSTGHPVKYSWQFAFNNPVYPDLKGRWWVFANERLLLFSPEGKFLCDISSAVKSTWLPFPVYISFDRHHTAWVGTHNGLFSVSVEKNPFTIFLKPEVLADTRGIAEDKKGNLYIVQSGEVWRKPPSGGFARLNLPAWLAAARDKQGRLWFGDYSYMVHCFDPVSGERTTFYPPGAAGKQVYNGARALLPDARSGRIWVGTEFEGLAYIDTVKKCIAPYTAYNDFQHLEQATIHCFFQDGPSIWIGTRQGVYQLDPGKGVVAEYSRRTGHLPHDDILYIYKDKDGIFWLASGGGGLIRWDRDRGTYRQFTRRDGLSHNIVYAVYEDDYQQLWLPSNYGLMRFDKQSFQVNTYLPRDGLPHEEFNFTSHYQAADGRLYFGGLGGVISFYPKGLYREALVAGPGPGIGRYLELDGATGAFVDKTAELLSANRIRLAPRNKSFLLSVLFPDYQCPKDNRFAYRLEGLSEVWTYQTDNTIRVNGLPSGSFTLHVKAQGAKGRWSAQELSLPLAVAPPFYLRWWFLAACVALAAALLWWRIRALKQAAAKLDAEVKKRTLKIEQDKQLIEKQAAELRQLDELKSRFFANMAHELRTPITLILSPLKRILKEADLDNRTFTSLKLIQSNANNLLRLAEEVLDMDKLEARQLKLHEETAAFYPLIRRLVSTFESHAQANGVELQFDYQAERYLQLKLDINKLERIVFNLLSNALKFTPRDGKVAVTVKDAGSSIQVIVSDTGRGIHPGDLLHVFERFYQGQALSSPPQSSQRRKAPAKGSLERPSPANPSPSRGPGGAGAKGGAGIGLALAREYAHLMGGSLSVESAPGKGSSFAFEFPRKEVFAAWKQPESEKGKDSGPGVQESQPPTNEQQTTNKQLHPELVEGEQQTTILIVEDNSDLRSFLHDVLSAHYEVIPAENGARALELLDAVSDQAPAPELLITDLMMPEMDGYSLIEALKADARWQSIPVIVLTARASLPDRLAALRFGVDDYLAKPFDTEELLARAANLIQNYRKRLEWRRNQAAEARGQMNSREHFPRLEQLLQSEETVAADTQWLEKVEKIAFRQAGNSDFNPEELAGELAISSRQLLRKLKQLTGMTIADYLREIRLQKARQMLERKACSTVAEACYAVGLSSPKHFTRIFRQRFGKNPSDYLSEN